MVLSADELHVIKWYVDADFAVHTDFKSLNGGSMIYGTEMPISVSRKQKLNTCSSTQYELVISDYMSTIILCTKIFMEVQV